MTGFLALDRVAWAHLARALSAHIMWCRSDRQPVPKVLLELLEIADAERAGVPEDDTGRHRRTAIDGLADRPEGPPMEPLLLTYRQAATVLGVSSRTVQRMVAAGTLPSVEVLGSPRVRRSDLDAYVGALAPLPGRAGIETKQTAAPTAPLAAARRPVGAAAAGGRR